MEITTFAKKNKNKVFNIAVIIVALMVANNISKRQTKEIELVKEKISSQAKKNTVLGNISQLEGKINAYKDLFAEKDSNSSINIIASIAKDSGVNIISIRPEAQQRQEDYIKNPVNLIIEAPGFHALGNFISKLESYQKIVYILDNVEIKSDPRREELTVNLKVNSIKFRE